MDNRKVLKYCSCLMKVRGKNTTFKNTRKKTKVKKVKSKAGNVYNPYGICKASVMRGISPKRNMPCGLIYNFDLYTNRELKAYAVEKGLSLRHKGKPITRRLLLNRLNNKAKKEKKKVKMSSIDKNVRKLIK